MKSFFERVITDQEWLPIMKNASDHCVKNGLKNAESDQSALNVTKEECDVRYVYFINCFVLYSKLVSFLKNNFINQRFN
jgi:hypothetical protein